MKLIAPPPAEKTPTQKFIEGGKPAKPAPKKERKPWPPEGYKRQSIPISEETNRLLKIEALKRGMDHWELLDEIVTQHLKTSPEAKGARR